MLESVFAILPASLNRLMRNLPASILLPLEEIRVREGRPLEIVYRNGYGFVSADGSVLEQPHKAYMATQDDCLKLLDLLTNHSKYALEEQLKRGYITVRGGHRVGFAGRTVVEQGQVKQVKDISSFNIRIAKEVIDAGVILLPHLLDFAFRTVHHTLIISPPQQGKTTIVRDIARLISYGSWPTSGAGWKGLKVGIVDERSELAACVRGVPRFDLGPRTDVLDNCPKAEGMMMMIRSMSPEVLVVDEIGSAEDAAAIQEALHAGIRVIATAHGRDIEDVKQRPLLRSMIANQVFNRYVVLGNSQGKGTIEHVYDASGKRIEVLMLHKRAGAHHD
jgi:stage III sporulation protein AA